MLTKILCNERMKKSRKYYKIQNIKYKLISLLANVELLLVPLAGAVAVLLTDVWWPGDGPSGTIFIQKFQRICQLLK